MHTKANSTPAPRHLTKKLRPLLALAGSLAAASLLHSQTTWTGASVDNDNLTNADNWSNEAPSLANPGTIGSGATVIVNGNFSANISQTGGTVTSSGANRIYDTGTYTLSGGTLDIASNRFALRNGAHMIVNGGQITNSNALTGEIFRIETASSVFEVHSNVNLGGGGLIQTNGNTIIDGANLSVGTYQFSLNIGDPVGYAPGILLQNGASLTAVAFNYGANVGTSYGLISFGSGVNNVSAASTSRFTDFNFDFAVNATGSSISIASGALTEAQWETRWANGDLTVNGSNAGNFADFFTVSGNTLTYTAVPEPGSFALIGAAGALAFAGTRRRRHAL